MTQRPMPQLQNVAHRYVRAGQVTLHVATAGPLDGPAVILLHGTPQNWWVWRAVIPALADGGYRVHALDLRGAGWSDTPAHGYEKEQLATDVLAAADALGIETFDVVGHDWGAFVAQLMAIRAPTRVRHLALIAIAPIWMPMLTLLRYGHRLAFMPLFAAPVIGPRLFNLAITWKLMRRYGMTTESAAFFQSCFKERSRRAAISQIYRTMVASEAIANARGRYNEDFLAMPVHVLNGGKDWAIHHNMAKSFYDHAPNLKITIAAHRHHFIIDEAPQEVIDWLKLALAAPITH